MSQLIGYTRKILASAISSIADELEQTVLDFNDAIQVLSSQPSTNQDNSSKPEPIITSRLGRPVPTAAGGGRTSAVHQPTTTSPSPTLQRQINREAPSNREVPSDREVPINRSHSVATTRQPEAIGFSPILNVRLSRSSPSLLPEVSHHLVSHKKQEASCSRSRPGVTNSSSLDSGMSSSSQCLVHIPAPARSNQIRAQDNARNGVSISSSPVSEIITRGATSLEGDEVTAPCTRIRSINVLTKIGQKRPGRVVRSQCLSPNGLPEIKLNQLSSDKVDTGTQTETVTETALVLSSSCETDARRTHWFSLRPFSQVLSFAFSQFANIVLMFSEETQSPDATRSSSHRRQLSITFDNAERNQETYPDTTVTDSYSVITFGIAKEPSSLESPMPMLSSVYSCESFEVIDSSSSERRSCSPPNADCPVDRSFLQRSCSPHDGDSQGDRSFLSRLYSDTNATQTEDKDSSVQELHGCKDTDPLSASAEFFQFDFKELVSNRQLNKLNPLGGVSVHCSEFSNERFASGVKTSSKMVDLQVTGGEAKSDMKDTTSKICDETEEKDCGNSDEDDEDDDGSASFTVLSENGDEEFIVLEMNH